MMKNIHIRYRHFTYKKTIDQYLTIFILGIKIIESPFNTYVSRISKQDNIKYPVDVPLMVQRFQLNKNYWKYTQILSKFILVGYIIGN